MSQRDPAAEQLSDYKRSHHGVDLLTTSDGIPVGNKNASLTVGPRGPILLEDMVYLDEMAHFDKERIPERVVHAKGAGASGYFEVTHDITRYSKAALFQRIGQRTPLAMRFSQVGGERGSADTVRDPRGFAMRLYTEEGNWDLVGNNTPIFFIRDPMLFPSFIHTQKRNPRTNLKDKDMFWDFLSLRPESLHQVSILFSDRGIPDGYRHMHGYGSHTFKLVNAEGEAVYCKFHMRTNQGIRNLDPVRAMELAGSDPDYSVRDLYNAIAEGRYPSWTMYIQVMTYEQAENFRWNPFDLTKVWPTKEYPLQPVGMLTLDKNPSNYFVEVELGAFNPANMVPGIEPSPDKMLQGRLFSYRDTQHYRIGVNVMQLPINCPYRVNVRNYQRDGAMCPTNNQDGAPNYYPNSFSGPQDNPRYLENGYRQLCGDVQRYNSGDEDNYSQVGFFWRRVLDDGQRERLAKNIAEHLKGAQEFIQQRAVRNFSLADPNYGRAVQEALDALSLAD